MDRRSFFKAAGGLTLGVVAGSFEAGAAVTKTGGLRFSTDEDDPGYRNYCITKGDGKKIKILLDGVEQRYCITADEAEGMVKRTVITPDGNIAHDGEKWIDEIVYGSVEIQVYQ